MIAALRNWTDQLLGRGAAAITVPMFDGALKPNQILEQAETFAELEDPEDLATDGTSLFVADGATVLRYDGNAVTTVAQLDQRITGLAVLPHGGLALALGGTELRVVGGPHDGRTWTSITGNRLNAANAIHATADGRLLVTDGSQAQPCDRWCQMAPVNQARYGHRVGDDGGCFAAALEAVRRCQLPTADLGHHEVRFLRGVHEGGERIPRPERQPNPHGQVCGLQTGENINVDLFERLLFLYCEKGLR